MKKKKTHQVFAEYSKILLNVLVLTLCLFLFSCAGFESKQPVGAKKAIEAVSVMGDWQGNEVLKDGTVMPLAAQVITLGQGKYRANLLAGFDKCIEPIAVLEGQLEGGAVRFAEPNEQAGGGARWQAVIEGSEFTGSFRGQKSGSFVMSKICRLSPMLEARPPADGIVLFDGKNFDQWQPGDIAGFVNIGSVIGKDKAVAAYLRCEFWSQRQQPAVLELGSDDAVKVWLNGQIVHANNVFRGIQQGQDKVKVTLREGWNVLMLKVTNNGGQWGACAHLFGEDGEPLYDVWERDIYVPERNPTRTYLDMNGGYLTAWFISGPYLQEGKDTKEIFDVVFAPEKGGGEDVKWQAVERDRFEKKTIKWKIIDDVMEVNPATGSIVSRKKFTNFRLHMEFRTPFMPEASGQDRGNSGVYLQGRYEVQILDSYGLEGKDNECGGIYKVSAPLVNMCAPPIQWQSYDITFCAPRFDDNGKKIKDACLTVLHNGVKIHDKVTVAAPTAYPLDARVGEPGGILLQDHGNRVQYRNIWVVELPEKACD